MRGHLVITIPSKDCGVDRPYTLSVETSPLDVAQLYASRHGFYDLDVEADERGVKIVASAHKRSLTARGKNLTEACQRLVEAIYDNG